MCMCVCECTCACVYVCVCLLVDAELRVFMCMWLQMCVYKSLWFKGHSPEKEPPTLYQTVILPSRHKCVPSLSPS